MSKKMKIILGIVAVVVIFILISTGDSNEVDKNDEPIVVEEPEEEESAEEPEEEESAEEPEEEESAEEPEEVVEDEESNEATDTEDITPDKEIENVIQARIDEGDYNSAVLDRITINRNMGDEENETYIALVYFDFDIRNTRSTANDMMRMYSDDLAATLANQGFENIAEIAIFWEDDYNDRNVKYAYEYENGNFFVMDIAGE